MGTWVQATALAFVNALTPRQLTYNNATVSGNDLEIAVIAYNGTTTVPDLTVIDNKGNTFVEAATVSGTPASTSARWRKSIFRCPNIAGGASHQITVTPSISSFITLAIAEFNGYNVFDNNASGNLGSTAAPSLANVPVSQANNLIVAAMSQDGATIAITPGGNYLEAVEIESATNMPISMIYDLDADAAQNADWTLGAARTSIAVAVSIKEIDTGPAFKRHFRRNPKIKVMRGRLRS